MPTALPAARVIRHPRWPLLAAALLNGESCAIRPALTRIDRQRFLELAPTVMPELPRSEQALIRADLIEDKLQGGLIGTLCVYGSRIKPQACLRLHAMRDNASTRAAVWRLLRQHLPRLPAESEDHGRQQPPAAAPLPRSLGASLALALGVPDSYARDHALDWIDEPEQLHYAGRDYVGRTLWLQHGTMQAWQAMRRNADDAGVRLEAVSGFRSMGYQAGILRRKLDRGMDIDAVLAINTAPGFSEHHSGRAVDIGTPNCPPAEEVFETTPAFAWLRQHAAQFGFRMSYPRGNRHGVIYEPWHWYWNG